MHRIARAVTAIVVGVLAIVLVPTVASPPPLAAAPRAVEPFSLSLVEGELQVRAAEEPLALGTPTTLSGSYDTGDGGTGTISGTSFATPSVSFETQAQGFPVFVDATFSQVTPGSGTGAIDAEGNMVVQMALRADLDIDVGSPPLLTAECTTTPVNVTLDSVAPYDEVTRRVTLADADFTVPTVATTPECESIVANGINDQLAGAGHSLTMTFEGDLTRPLPADCVTFTDLDVAPSESLLGDLVTLTTTVTVDPASAGIPECDEAESGPLGFVELRDGTQVLGTAALDGSGVAVFSTSNLPAGTRTLTARYRGSAPYFPSLSPEVSHRVASRPLIVTDIPESLPIGGAPVEFNVTVTNTGFGPEVINARLDMSLRRVTGGGSNVGATRFTLEYLDGVTWVPVTLQGATEAFGAISPSTGAPLAPGQQVTRRVRLTVKATATPALVDALFKVVKVDPTTGLPAPVVGITTAVVGSSVIRTHLVNVPRRATSLAPVGLRPHTARQGQTIRVASILITPSVVTGLRPKGSYEVLLDGVPVPVRTDSLAPELGYQPEVTIDLGGESAEFVLPPDVATGTHTVTVRYSGDRFFAPSQWSDTITVLPARGATYTCLSINPFFTDRFTVNVEAHADLPSAVASGEEAALSHMDISLFSDRGSAVEHYGGNFPPSLAVVPPESTDDGVRRIAFGLGEGEEGTAAALTFTNNVQMTDATRPVDPDPDQVIGFTGESGAVTVVGDPGEVVPVRLESIVAEAILFGGAVFNLECEPLGQPLELGQVTVAGTTLAVDAPDPTRAGDDVTLRAAVAPAGATGTVEFLDGTTTVGAVPVEEDGTAQVTTDALAVGTHSLTARFFGGLLAISTTSSPVELVVLPEFDCEAFVEAGDGAVVRLVYMQLLGRCPDPAGFAYWVARLEGGTSAAGFASAILATDEAQGQMVAKAYEMMLGRAPDPAGTAFWVARLRDGFAFDQLLAALAGSEEFWVQAGSTDEGFVSRLYERVLQRAADPPGLAYWVAQVEAGRPRGDVARSFTALPEPRERLVAAAYGEILGRAPTPGELADGIDQLGATGDLAAVYAQLIGSLEFQDRAQGFPNFDG